MAFAGVKDVVAERTRGSEDALDGADGCAGERKVVAHFIHIPAWTAEIRLHVDDEEDGVFRAQIAVIGPRIGIGFDGAGGHMRK